jgi:DinB superfamily
VVDFYRTHYGPMSRAFASLDREAQEQLRSELSELWSAHNRAHDETTKVDAGYLEVIATRDGQATDGARRTTGHTSTSRRAESLAPRIEQGAAVLAAFAEGLSEAEWRAPVSKSDTRPIGVIVHHVAAAYPIEVDLARAIARGQAVLAITPDSIARLNAEHAREYAGVTKKAALELLRKNSREAAAAVRAFTDQELDNAAPFSLSFDAPVTAQFVIEDHALRHSWHHLAAIRKAVGR